MFRFLILGLLRGGARIHGYALVKEYRERSGAAVSSGNFYRELQRLIRDGLICSTANPAEVDARRTAYEITASGVAVFDDWFTAQDAAVDRFSEDAISARALFIPDAEPALVEALLNGLKENLWLWNKQLERERQRIGSRAERAAHCGSSIVLPLLLARRQKYVAADLDFIEALKSAYEHWRAAHRPAVVSEAATAGGPRGKALRRRAEPTVATGSRATNRSAQ